MFSSLRMGPAASGLGLCHIDKVFPELVNQVAKNRIPPSYRL